MMSLSGYNPRSRRAGQQVCRRRLAPVSLALALAGCSEAGPAPPIVWWHALQGGAIAEQRPPPPGATDPYPNLASVPQPPPAVDVATRARIGTGLELDRIAAEQRAADAPLAASAAPAPPPAPAMTAGNPTASVAAAEAPPPAKAATARAPAPVGAPPPGAAASATPPNVPAAPPPPPMLQGLEIPLPPPAAAPAPATAGPVRLGGTVIVAFPLGSAELPAQAAASLKALAARRAGAPVAVEAHGEAGPAADPAAQSQALALGLRRAQAMAQALVDAGVPGTALRIDAQARGRGGAARLLD